jgi:hypothetical protein
VKLKGDLKTSKHSEYKTKVITEYFEKLFKAVENKEIPMEKLSIRLNCECIE